jgi:uncharacterized membrane protein HdeD (DUF308 family)
MRVTAAIDRLIRAPVAWLPVWAVLPVAVLCVVGGAVLTLRPFSSVETLVALVGINAILAGVLTLVSPAERSPSYRWLPGAGWVVLGIVVLVWPGLGVDALAVIVGVALVVNGAAGIATAVRADMASGWASSSPAWPRWCSACWR